MIGPVAVPTLADFLLARLAEDEADLPSQMAERHHETWYPAAKYREDVESKKRIVERCILADTRFAGFILRDLASVYADHPDFDPQWRV